MMVEYYFLKCSKENAGVNLSGSEQPLVQQRNEEGLQGGQEVVNEGEWKMEREQ